MKKILSKSVEETKNIAANFAAELNGGDVISLSGNLGSGKTTFVQGLAEGLGVGKKVTSPTFVIIKEYSTIKNFSLVHVDLYRISSYSEAESAGLSSYLGENNKVCVVEWGEKISEFLPDKTKFLKFRFVNENTREIKGDL